MVDDVAVVFRRGLACNGSVERRGISHIEFLPSRRVDVLGGRTVREADTQ